ncbi:TPA: sulfatase-like hydrolase/transferase [Legionella bozemanae]
MLDTLYKNWRYLFITAFFLTALLTAFLADNSINILSPEALFSYLILMLLSLIPGCIMVFASVHIRILTATFLVLLFIISQIKSFPVLPYGLKYRYVILLAAIFIACIFYYLRHYLDKLLFVFFGTLWVGSFFISKHPLLTVQNFNQTKNHTNLNLPPYIEVVLDEHIGLEGISPKDDQNNLVSVLKDKYINLGFRVYGKAYSRDFRSLASFASFLNFKPIDNLKDYILHNYEEDRHILTQNALFETLSNKGYDINIIQSSYLDLCAENKNFNLVKCITYKHTAPVPVNPVLSSSTKSIAILEQVFSKLRFNFSKIKKSKIWSMLHLPQSENQSILTPSTATYQAFNEVEKLAKTVQVNNAYFIHLLLPHAPYVFNKNCEYIGESQNKTKAYFEQLECTHKLIGAFLKTLETNQNTKNSIIVIHGDHGSRIEEPDIRLNYKFTPENIIKNYSAFFVVKNSFNEPGYDLTALPLDFLLKNIFTKIERPTPDSIKKTIYLRSGKDFDLGKRIMPNFSNGIVLTQSIKKA